MEERKLEAPFPEAAAHHRPARRTAGACLRAAGRWAARRCPGRRALRALLHPGRDAGNGFAAGLRFGAQFFQFRPAAFDRRALRLGRLQPFREVEAPAQFRLVGALEVDGTVVDQQQLPICVAQETLRKCGFDFGRRGGEAGNRAGDLGADIISLKAEIRVLDRAEAAAEFPDLPAIRRQIGIAAVDPGDLHRLPGGIIEHADVGRGDERIAQLLDGRRAIFRGVGGDELGDFHRAPGDAAAPGDQIAEIGQLVGFDVAVEAEVAEERADIAAAAGEREIHAHLRGAFGALQVRFLPHPADPGEGFEIAMIKAQFETGGKAARRQIEDAVVGDRLHQAAIRV